MDHMRTDYINKTIAQIVKTKPSYITIEDLNVKGMMKNRHLSKAVASSKTCHHCGSIKKDLNLFQIEFIDVNAAMLQTGTLMQRLI